MKQCIVCNEEKELDEFYLHKGMTDGHLNKCKQCCKQQAQERQDRLFENPAWREQEKMRAREKYKRLNYKEKHKPTQEVKREAIRKYKEKYPEKHKAKNASRHLPKAKGSHLHHWSYRVEHWKDVIELSVADHNLLHRFLQYDQSLYLYRDLEENLLESAQAHMDLLAKIKQA